MASLAGDATTASLDAAAIARVHCVIADVDGGAGGASSYNSSYISGYISGYTT